MLVALSEDITQRLYVHDFDPSGYQVCCIALYPLVAKSFQERTHLKLSNH